MSTIANFPATPVLFLNAANVDGVGNSFLSHASDVSSWAAEGTGSLPNFSAVGATGPVAVRANPYLKSGPTEVSVAFDGVFDQLQSVGSAGMLNFIHETGIFDLFIVHRRRSGGNERRLFGCSGGSAQKGISVLQQIDSTGGDGLVTVTIGNNTGLLITFSTTVLVEIGRPTLLLIRGDGTQLRVTKNLYGWESKSFTGSLATGNAFGDYFIGSYKAAAATPELFEGDYFVIAAYARNLSLQELVTFKTAAENQLGTGL